ncbi:hypothetical protein ABIB62_000963 [Mucilaginibacter sp. UYP25]
MKRSASLLPLLAIAFATANAQSKESQKLYHHHQISPYTLP